MLRLNHFIGQYKRMAKQQGDTVMSKDSIRYYLTTSGAYLGMKASERWKVYKDGYPMKTTGYDRKGNATTIEVCKFDRCMCFDYNILRDKFDLNLESVTSDIAEERENQENEKERKHFEERREPDMFRNSDLP